MRTYTVQDGDTLSGICLRELGDADLAGRAFLTNRDVIVAEQRRRGVDARVIVRDEEMRAFCAGREVHYASPPEANFIYPGTVLTLPERPSGSLQRA